jgi:radical SAM protein with 4Fe4S-binding SPASM domain
VIEPLHSVVQVLAGGRPAFCHFSDTKCGHVLTLYPDGRIGSCDELRMPLAQLAHVSQVESVDEILAMRTNTGLATRLEALFEKCNACDYRPTCRGGCLSTRLQFQGTEYDDEYCAYRSRLIDYVAAEIGAAI